jgi:hypothetical protein
MRVLKGISGLLGLAATLGVTVASLTLLLPAHADAPRGSFNSAHTSDDRDSLAEKVVFTPETSKVYVAYNLSDVTPGSKIRIVWTAEKAEGVIENFKMGQLETTATSRIDGLFSYSKPTKGWPTGTYRVDLFIDGRLGKTLHFKVNALKSP